MGIFIVHCVTSETALKRELSVYMKHLKTIDQIGKSTYWIEFQQGSFANTFWHQNSKFLNPDTLLALDVPFQNALGALDQCGPPSILSIKVQEALISTLSDFEPKTHTDAKAEIIELLKDSIKHRRELSILGI